MNSNLSTEVANGARSLNKVLIEVVLRLQLAWCDETQVHYDVVRVPLLVELVVELSPGLLQRTGGRSSLLADSLNHFHKLETEKKYKIGK